VSYVWRPDDVGLRRARPGDEAGLARYFRSLPERDRYFRFGSTLVTDKMVRRIAQTQPPLGEWYLATIPLRDEGHPERILGEASWARSDPKDPYAELAISIAPSWRRLGLGRALIVRAVAAGIAHGVTTFTAETLSENRVISRWLDAMHPVAVERDGSRTNWSFDPASFVNE
jgi:GNAT superfamily N-acetyltransferase